MNIDSRQNKEVEKNKLYL